MIAAQAARRVDSGDIQWICGLRAAAVSRTGNP